MRSSEITDPYVQPEHRSLPTEETGCAEEPGSGRPPEPPPVKESANVGGEGAGVWRDIEARFRELRKECGDGLDARWTSESWNESGDQWYLSGATNDRERERFTSLVERAVVELGHPGGNATLAYWLDLLKADRPNFRSRTGLTQLNAAGTTAEAQAGNLSRLIEASADYCLKLETKAILNARSPKPSPREKSTTENERGNLTENRRQRIDPGDQTGTEQTIDLAPVLGPRHFPALTIFQDQESLAERYSIRSRQLSDQQKEQLESKFCLIVHVVQQFRDFKTPPPKPVDHWLDCLGTEIRGYHCRWGVEHILTASETYCRWLAIHAPERATTFTEFANRFAELRNTFFAMSGDEDFSAVLAGSIEQWTADVETAPRPAQPVASGRTEALPTALQDAAARATEPKLRAELQAVIRYRWYLRELQALKTACKRHQTPALLKEKFPDFAIWNVLEDIDQKDAASGAFTPNVYAWSLVKRVIGLGGNGIRTLKKYRRDLRHAGLL